MKKLHIVYLVLLMSGAVAAAAAAADSLGIAGRFLVEKLQAYGIGVPEVMGLLAFVVSGIAAGLRAAQRYLQGRKTVWRFIDNKLTLSIIDRIIGAVFGKTTLIYGAKIECSDEDREKAFKEAARITAEHMLRKRGSDMLKAFADAVGKKPD
jgi:hypothetical protein